MIARRKTALVLLIALALYAAGYVAFRQARAETWARDGRRYVIFPDGSAGRALYYLWRPLSYVDGSLTGIGAHIGPHR
jgi:hypothetical protein